MEPSEPSRLSADAPPLVDGLRLTERIDDAGSGETWRARRTGGIAGDGGRRLPGELPGVGECVVRLVRMPVDETLRARARALAGDLVSLQDPGLVRVRSALPAYDGVALVIEPPSPAVPLDALARERLLSAGEVVTLGVAVAWALAAAHEQGIAHGRLRGADILLDAAGRPRLAGVGVRGVLGSAGHPADDVRSLARLLRALLDTDTAGARHVLAALSDQEGTASELAARLADAAAAAPIRLTDAEPPQPPTRRRAWAGGLLAGVLGRSDGKRWRRRIRLVASGVAVVLVAGAIGWASTPAPAPRAAAPPAPVHPQGTNWRAVLTRLDTVRAAAFARPDTGFLTAFDVPGTPASRYDAAAIAALRRRGARAFGLRLVLERVTVRGRTGAQVTLSVTDRRMAYRITDANGRLISRVAARGSRSHLIVLRAGAPPNAWRIAEVSDPLS